MIKLIILNHITKLWKNQRLNDIHIVYNDAHYMLETFTEKAFWLSKPESHDPTELFQKKNLIEYVNIGILVLLELQKGAHK